MKNYCDEFIKNNQLHIEKYAGKTYCLPKGFDVTARQIHECTEAVYRKMDGSINEWESWIIAELVIKKFLSINKEEKV